MTQFWRALLRSDLPHDIFDHLDVAVFGIGDSSYERFCWAGKKLHRRLLTLGARDIVERVDADEQHYLGIDGTLTPWIASLTAALDVLHPLPAGSLVIPITSLLPPKAVIERVEDVHPPASSASQTARLKSINRITRSDWFQDVRHIELEIDGNSIAYQAGDVAVLCPINAPGDVNELIQRQNWSDIADQMYRFLPRDSAQILPWRLGLPITLRDLCTTYLDITAVPRRIFFEFCRNFCEDEREREKMEEFCTPTGQDELYTYCQRPRRTILEVLSEFRSVRIPLDYLLDVIQPIRPRKFSIASSPIAHPGEIHLCVAIVRYKSLSLRALRKGLCTSWLTRLSPGDVIPIRVEAGIQRSALDLAKPIILIGPGTGIAPMRAFIEERVAGGAKDNLLYAGCRSFDADYHYRAEWEEYARKGALVAKVAASRDQENKVYVQDLIRQDADLITDFISTREGSVYIAGSSNKMPTAVRKSVVFCLSRNGWDESEAEKYIDGMEREGRWVEECWS